jgi:hypothetical protein
MELRTRRGSDPTVSKLLIPSVLVTIERLVCFFLAYDWRFGNVRKGDDLIPGWLFDALLCVVAHGIGKSCLEPVR